MDQSAVTFATLDDKAHMERTPLDERWSARTVFERLEQTAARHGQRPAISFQIRSGPKEKAETYTWTQMRDQSARAANLFRRLGVGDEDVVAYLLPNCNETAIALIGGATAGVVNPINPLLEADQIGALLRETGAKVLVTLAPFPKTDVAQKAAQAAALAPNVKTILQVDLKRYLAPPISWLIPLMRPKVEAAHGAKVLDFHSELAREATTLGFAENVDSARIGAYFHTGGTTGMPKIAQHEHAGMLYNGWASNHLLVKETDVLLCPLPLFHVFAAYPILISCVTSGAHMVMPTPQGYRGDGVF
ncbi:MAG: AMP-binding protein, partial [Pseudomonadota bacterium]